MPIGSFTSNRNINATTPHATPITVCQRPPRRRPLHPGPAVVACRKSLARKESRRGLSHPRSSPHTQRIAESTRAAPIVHGTYVLRSIVPRLGASHLCIWLCPQSPRSSDGDRRTLLRHQVPERCYELGRDATRRLRGSSR